MTNNIKKKAWMSWSSGKDSAYTLHEIQIKHENIEIVGLLTTITQEFKRVSMHGTREELLKEQACQLNIPLRIIRLPDPCSHDDYQNLMKEEIDRAQDNNIDHIIFGDIFLDDIRRYRENQMEQTGIKPLFPIWNKPTKILSNDIIKNGFKAIVTCIDLNKLPIEFCGRYYDNDFLNDLPEGIDPCGELGEFHTLIFDAPNFNKSIDIRFGDVVKRGDFAFCDILHNALR